MIRILLTLLICIIAGLALFGQTREINSLKNIIHTKTNDRAAMRAALDTLVKHLEDINEYDSVNLYARMEIHLLPKPSDTAYIDTSDVIRLTNLGSIYMFHKPDSAILLSTQALKWARQIDFRRGEAGASAVLGESYRINGEYARALELYLNARQISREINDAEGETSAILFMGISYSELIGEDRMGLNYMLQGMDRQENLSFRPMIPFMWSNIGNAYEKLGLSDSALQAHEKAANMFDSMKMKASGLKSHILIGLGRIYRRLGNPEKAGQYYHEAIRIKEPIIVGIAQFLLADLFYSLQQPDSSFYYARLGFVNCQKSSQESWVLETSRLLVKLFENRNMTDSAYHYQSIALAIRDSVFSPQKFNNLQLAAVNEQQANYEIQQRQQEAEQEREKLANRTKVYGLLAALVVFLLIALILLRNNREKQKANALLERQKNEITRALTDLKTTQTQLIQSEKMASLGELTAGIAHEIQNPLNFINNFSEVNAELITELDQVVQNGNLEEVRAITTSLKENEEKINHHGKRADAIVKNMLQHSRIGTGNKEPTDINALADEYLRIAYHGMRAKDKSFNADLQTIFDKSLGRISVVPQDLGRVLLNLYNNAFYAVNEKKKQLADGYEPTVLISTESSNGKIVITVKDNGNGIPEKIHDKIFQPFFTTKPSGQGTGLGLSLAYDIIKVHGGEITVNTKGNEETEFKVILPI